MWVLTRGVPPYQDYIRVGKVKHVYYRDKNIDIWRCVNEFKYEGARCCTPYKKIPNFTAIWDKRENRWVFRYDEPYNACFSTVIIKASYDLNDLVKLEV